MKKELKKLLSSIEDDDYDLWADGLSLDYNKAIKMEIPAQTILSIIKDFLQCRIDE